MAAVSFAPPRLPAMFLPSRHYVSEHTTFIRDLLARKPEIVDEQKRGRAIWWDKTPRELAEDRKMDRDRVPQPPYVYQTK
jgi:hypothetical protein